MSGARLVLAVLSLLAGAAREGVGQGEPLVTVGSKQFTEAVILGELVAGLAREAGYAVEHRRELGGTQFVWRALVRGDVDVYVDYTGTIREEILAGRSIAPDADVLREVLAEFGVGVSRPLGFNNTYAIAMREDVADRLDVTAISDLRRHPGLRFGFTNEFMARNDGWPGLQRSYRLPQQDVQGLDHDVAYRALANGAIQVQDVYSTDAEIAYYDLRVLDDDLGYFPVYEAVVLFRQDLERRAPGLVDRLRLLEGVIPAREMVAMNAAAKLDGVPEVLVAAQFLREHLGIETAAQAEDWLDRLRRNTGDHLFLVGVSLAGAIALAVPLGIVAALRPVPGQVVLGVVGVIQTIPSLALLVFMIPLLGIGARPAIVALFLYSLLPIVRNTHAGLRGIADDIRESAEALGLPRRARLRLVELPMASGAIIAGIKTSAVINIGTATLGALIGAGGYGQPIITGIRLDSIGLILEGAVPAALLALAVQGAFDLAERVVVPRGLRVGRGE